MALEQCPNLIYNNHEIYTQTKTCTPGTKDYTNRLIFLPQGNLTMRINLPSGNENTIPYQAYVYNKNKCVQ